MEYSNGDIYKGGWEDDHFNGYGEYYWKSGAFNKGNWKNGKGHGIMKFKNENQELIEIRMEEGKVV